jgi:hypothetical protein
MESDYLVALSHSSTAEGRLLALSWCAYHIVTKTTSEESCIFIAPSGEDLADLFASGEVTKITGLTLQDMQNAQDLPSAMQCLNKAFYESIILQNANFTLLTYRDNLLCRILPDECTRQGLKLAPHFFKYFDICTEFEKKCPEAGPSPSLSKMLQTFGMLEISERITAQEECKTMIRLISRLLNNSHVFASPKDVNTEKSKLKVAVQQSVKKQSSILEIPVPSRVVLVKGIKASCEIYEVEEFFYGLRVERIVPVVDIYGEKSELWLAKFASEEDALEAVLYDRRRMKKRIVIVEEASEEMFGMAVANLQCGYAGEKLVVLKSKDKNIAEVAPSKEKVGMTYLFAEWYYFVVEDKPERSFSLNLRVDEQELMGNLKVSQSSSQLFLTMEQISRAAKIRGFVNSVQKNEVIEFLRDVEVFKYNVFIRRGGKEKSGVEVVVILNTTEERERVCKVYSNRLYKNRLIEIYPYS